MVIQSASIIFQMAKVFVNRPLCQTLLDKIA